MTPEDVAAVREIARQLKERFKDESPETIHREIDKALEEIREESRTNQVLTLMKMIDDAEQGTKRREILDLTAQKSLNEMENHPFYLDLRREVLVRKHIFRTDVFLQPNYHPHRFHWLVTRVSDGGLPGPGEVSLIGGVEI